MCHLALSWTYVFLVTLYTTVIKTNHQNGADFAKKEILFGSGSSECQQRAQVYQ